MSLFPDLFFLLVFAFFGFLFLLKAKLWQNYNLRIIDVQISFFGNIPLIGLLLRFNRRIYASNWGLFSIRITGIFFILFSPILIIFPTRSVTPEYKNFMNSLESTLKSENTESLINFIDISNFKLCDLPRKNQPQVCQKIQEASQVKTILGNTLVGSSVTITAYDPNMGAGSILTKGWNDFRSVGLGRSYDTPVDGVKFSITRRGDRYTIWALHYAPYEVLRLWWEANITSSNVWLEK